MIYEGQAKRRMAKILEPRSCICPTCKTVKRVEPVYPWPAAKNIHVIKPGKEKDNARR